MSYARLLSTAFPRFHTPVGPTARGRRVKDGLGDVAGHTTSLTPPSLSPRARMQKTLSLINMRRTSSFVYACGKTRRAESFFQLLDPLGCYEAPL